MVSTLICPLFMVRSPATIVRGIRPVIVDTIERFTFWSFTHIGQEVFKDTPSVHNTDSTTTIKLPVTAFRVVAARLHGPPCPMCRRVISSARMSVSKPDCGSNVGSKTSTRFGMPISQMRTLDDDFGTTVTTASPSWPLSDSVGNGNGCKFSESLIGNIQQPHGVSHV
jgi:hypothetical protein